MCKKKINKNTLQLWIPDLWRRIWRDYDHIMGNLGNLDWWIEWVFQFQLFLGQQKIIQDIWYQQYQFPIPSPFSYNVGPQTLCLLVYNPIYGEIVFLVNCSPTERNSERWPHIVWFSWGGWLRTPAPADSGFIPRFIGFQPSRLMISQPSAVMVMARCPQGSKWCESGWCWLEHVLFSGKRSHSELENHHL